MDKKLAKRLEAKFDHLWQIATHCPCGKNVNAIWDLYQELHVLFTQQQENHAS